MIQRFINRTLWIVATVSLLAGCSPVDSGKATARRVVTALMDSAQAIMNDNPERALLLMDSIDSHSIRSRALNARYALLYTESQYKCYIDQPSDSLIMIAVRYYSVGNHPEQLFRSFYSLGCIYAELGQYTDAAIALSEAERLTSYVNDDYRLGLLYSKLGFVYSESYDSGRAGQYYKKAADCYQRAGKEKHMVYALYEIAHSFIDELNFDGADTILIKVQDWSVDNSDSYLLNLSQISRLSCSLYSDRIDSSSVIISRYLSLFGEPQNDWHILSLFAFYHIKQKNYSKAQSYLQKAWHCNLSVSDSINLYFFEYLMADSKGLKDDALAYHRKYVSLQNDNIRPILHQPVLGAQKDYFQTIAKLESLKNKHISVIFALCMIIFLLILIIVIVNHYYQKKHIEEQLYDSIALVEELTVANHTHTDKIAHLRSEVQKQFRERHDVSNIIYSMYYDSQNQEKITKQQLIVAVKSLIKEYTSSENIRSLDKLLNDTFNGIMDRLSMNEELNLSDKELQLLRFSLAGLSLKSISIIINESTQNIYQVKSRLMKKIRKKSTGLYHELDNLL